MTDTMWTTVADPKPDPNEPVRFALQGCNPTEIADSLRRLGPERFVQLMAAAKETQWFLRLAHPRRHPAGASVPARPVEVILICNLRTQDGVLDYDLVRDGLVLGVNLLKGKYGMPTHDGCYLTHYQKFVAGILSGAVSEALAVAQQTDREALAHEIERTKSVQAEDAAYAMRLLL